MSENAVEYRADGGDGAKDEARRLMVAAAELEEYARQLSAKAAHCHAEAARLLTDALEAMGILKRVERLKS